MNDCLIKTNCKIAACCSLSLVFSTVVVFSPVRIPKTRYPIASTLFPTSKQPKTLVDFNAGPEREPGDLDAASGRERARSLARRIPHPFPSPSYLIASP